MPTFCNIWGTIPAGRPGCAAAMTGNAAIMIPEIQNFLLRITLSLLGSLRLLGQSRFASGENVVQVVVRRHALSRQHIDGPVDRYPNCSAVLVHPGVRAKNMVLLYPQLLQLLIGSHFDARFGWDHRLPAGLAGLIAVIEVAED